MRFISILSLILLDVKWTVGQVSADSISQPQPVDFAGEDTPYQIQPNPVDVPTPDGVQVQNILGTWLYGYTGCKKQFPGGKKKIDDAYYDSWVMANVAGVKSDIDWNSAAALEFLGPPGLNKDQQSQIQSVLANIATVIYTYKNPLFVHYIKVRCDDPAKKCQNRPKNDPCKPSPSDPNTPPKSTPLAYAANADPDDQGYPMINFCEGFMNSRSLADAVTYGKALNSPNNLKLGNYDNRAAIFYHELTHLNLAAASPDPNPPVLDLKLDISLGNSGRTATFMAYGPLLTKVLARWQGSPSTGTAGYYVQRNADNLAYFALAKYVMTKNGDVYPHLPIVTQKLDGPPYPPVADAIVQFVHDDNNFYWNNTDSEIGLIQDIIGFGNGIEGINGVINDLNLDPGGGYPGCSDLADDNAASAAGQAIKIDGFAPQSAYPDDYNNQLSSWITAAMSSPPGATPTVKAPPPPASTTPVTPPPYVTGTCSFHLKETQVCLPNDKNLYAIINLKDGQGNDIGDTNVDPAKNPVGDPINANDPLSFNSKLPHPIVVTGEHSNDYVQFTYGDLSWQSKEPNGGAYCNNGGWDPRSGPRCGIRDIIRRNAENNMDCFFPC